ncbi:hypothetical protein QTI24_29855 [Variovorax sp. J22P240]|uniref:hypothetical protein n=1 Tax=Variovorax sp. J22P240 TaxID=3053514 RepID=UPI002578204E|nr:hypothetical protein [Variovorax sp. J22P240]MDM0002829.1 hypothetical protein [Variovorax sp. J22P240]
MNSLVALLTSGIGAATADVFDAPVPADASVMAAAPAVSENLKPLAGKWTGTLIGAQMQQQHTIVVERIEPGLAWVIWSVGTGRGQMAGGPSTWYRMPGTAHGDALVLSINGATATYKLESNEEMSVVSEWGGFKMKGKLKREVVPVSPYASDGPGPYWPPDIVRMQPGESQSAEKATFPDSLVIKPAASDTPAERSKWLGKWSGWSCRARGCDVKLAVLDVTAYTANVIQLFAAKGFVPNQNVRVATFVNDELRLKGGGYRVSYRMRPDGVVEVFHVSPTGSMAWGVLTKDPT